MSQVQVLSLAEKCSITADGDVVGGKPRHGQWNLSLSKEMVPGCGKLQESNAGEEHRPFNDHSCKDDCIKHNLEVPLGTGKAGPSILATTSEKTLSESNTASTSPRDSSPRCEQLDIHSGHPEWHSAVSPGGTARGGNGGGKSQMNPQRRRNVVHGSAYESRPGSAQRAADCSSHRDRRGTGGNSQGKGLSGRGSSNKPLPEQVELNRQLAKLDRADAVLTFLEEQRKSVRPNGTNLTTALHRIAARAGQRGRALAGDPRLGRVLEELVSLLAADPGALTPRELANALWGAAKLHVARAPLFGVVEGACRAAEGSGVGFNFQDLANLAWAAGSADDPALGILCFVVDACGVRSLDEMAPQAIANVAWALGRANYPAGDLLPRLAARAVELGPAAFKPEELSSCLWGMAVLGFKDETLLRGSVDHLVGTELADYNAQKLSTVLWALARLGYGGVALELFHMVEDYVTERTMQGFNPHNVACTVWAFATTRCDAVDLFACAEETVWKSGFKGYNAQEFVDLLWGMAISTEWTGTDCKDTFALAAKDLRRRDLAGYSPKQLSTLAWSFSKLGFFDPQAFSALERGFLAHASLRDFGDRELVFLAAAFQTLRDAEAAAGALDRRRAVSSVGVRLLMRLAQDPRTAEMFVSDDAGEPGGAAGRGALSPIQALAMQPGGVPPPTPLFVPGGQRRIVEQLQERAASEAAVRPEDHAVAEQEALCATGRAALAAPASG